MKRKNLVHLTLLAMLGVGGIQIGPTPATPCSTSGSAAATSAPYLLLVTFVERRTPASLAEFARSPYNGIAIAPVDAMDPNRPPTVDELFPTFSQYKAEAGQKDIWPWIFLNRLVGYDADESMLPYYQQKANVPPFNLIRGLDVDDAQGTKTGFLEMFRTSLQLARQLGSPGIALDLEFYNAQKWAAMNRVSQQSGYSSDQLVKKMLGIGGEMADIANEAYPQAQILCFNTGLTFPNYGSMRVRGGPSYYPARSYFVLGMLNRARQRNLNIQVFAGGENSLGYCQPSLRGLEENIAKRQSIFNPLLSRYPNLRLAGVIAPWLDISTRRGWMTTGNCANATARNEEDFIPYIQLLEETYPLVWIYAAPLGGYDPFDGNVTPRFNGMLQKAGAR